MMVSNSQLACLAYKAAATTASCQHIHRYAFELLEAHNRPGETVLAAAPMLITVQLRVSVLQLALGL